MSDLQSESTESNLGKTTNSQKLGAKILSVTVAIGFAICLFGIIVFLTSCESRAAQRVFLNTSLEFLGEYRIPNNLKIDGVPVGGLSGLTFDRQRGVFYAISDDRSIQGPARFYTLQVNLDSKSQLQDVKILQATTLKGADGKTYPTGSIDPEAIAISPRSTVFVASEGDRNAGIPPMIGEFDLNTGQLKQQLKLPDRYLPDKEGKRGVQSNLAFESLTIASAGAATDPLYLFTATEDALIQDQAKSTNGSNIGPIQNRWLQYLVSEQSGPLAEYAYQLDSPPLGAIEHGLSEVQALDSAGHFLTLERSLSLLGFKIKIFQAATGGATDISRIDSLVNNNGVSTISKQLVLDLADLKIGLDNLEGMSIGSPLPGGGNMLLVVSDNNFRRLQINQVLLFRLRT
jgi:hypothetical protein